MAKFPKAYLRALRAHLKPKADPQSGSATRVGARACRLGIETLTLARIHDAALLTIFPASRTGSGSGSGPRQGLAVSAASFFAEALGPIEATRSAAVESLAERGRLGDSVTRGAARLAAARLRLTGETARRMVVQEALTSSAGENRRLLRKSLSMEAELRQLSRNLLTSHEEERKRISRELHDALGQTLSAVNIGLASLKAAAAFESKEFRGNVSRTQRLVQSSMRTVHRFASSLRPMLLDDLGLVPALLGLAQDCGKRNGFKVRVSTPRESVNLGGERRTALFRVAQEALINVGRHARAKKARVTLRNTAGGVRLEVWNDGVPFDVDRVLRSRTNRRLGLLCMRERMDMVGGTLEIRSSKALGTTVRADVPLPGPARA